MILCVCLCVRVTVCLYQQAHIRFARVCLRVCVFHFVYTLASLVCVYVCVDASLV